MGVSNWKSIFCFENLHEANFDAHKCCPNGFGSIFNMYALEQRGGIFTDGKIESFSYKYGFFKPILKRSEIQASTSCIINGVYAYKAQLAGIETQNELLFIKDPAKHFLGECARA